MGENKNGKYNSKTCFMWNSPFDRHSIDRTRMNNQIWYTFRDRLEVVKIFITIRAQCKNSTKMKCFFLLLFVETKSKNIVSRNDKTNPPITLVLRREVSLSPVFFSLTETLWRRMKFTPWPRTDADWNGNGESENWIEAKVKWLEQLAERGKMMFTFVFRGCRNSFKKWNTLYLQRVSFHLRDFCA